MITKTIKTDYKLKNVRFDGGFLIDEDGEIINDLMASLATIFGNEPFDISASSTDKVNYDLEYFEQNKEDEE